MPVTFVLGGARSGKSAYAQRGAEAVGGSRSPLMIATAQAFDDEMRERIARHQGERGDAWRTIEAPLELPDALDQLGPQDVAVADCLTLWLTNLILGDHDVAKARDALLRSVRHTPARLWLVSNEVGLGIVPDNALSRRFRDEAGRLHQALAAQADEVVLIVAGLPLRVKPATSP